MIEGVIASIRELILISCYEMETRSFHFNSTFNAASKVRPLVLYLMIRRETTNYSYFTRNCIL